MIVAKLLFLPENFSLSLLPEKHNMDKIIY